MNEDFEYRYLTFTTCSQNDSLITEMNIENVTVQFSTVITR